MSSYAILPDELSSYINKWKYKKGSLIMVLHAVQDYYGYVPKDICFTLGRELKVPIARIYEVLTFYNYFSLEPPAKYKVSVCMGTACYLKGATEIFETLKSKEDKLFSIESVRCFGCCGLAPVAGINGKICGKLDKDKISNILEEYKMK